MKFPPLLREPLIHFLIIGLILFLISEQFLESSSSLSSGSKIVVSENRQQHLATLFESQTQRKPSQQEMNVLVDEYVLREAYYREALKFGLDKDDLVIKQRLQQKLELLQEDAVGYVEPDEALLQAWFRDNQSRFIKPSRYWFEQILLSDESEHDVPDLLLQLNNKKIDPVTLNTSAMLEINNVSQTEQEISNRFGDVFSAAVAMLAPNSGWQGPIESVFGHHLVLPIRMTPIETPAFEAIRTQVTSTYQMEAQRKNKAKFKERLLNKYEVHLE